MTELQSNARETLNCLFMNGPTYDGDLPSKTGRDVLVDIGYAARAGGYNWLTTKGVLAALERKLDYAKRRRRLNERRERVRLLMEAEEFGT